MIARTGDSSEAWLVRVRWSALPVFSLHAHTTIRRPVHRTGCPMNGRAHWRRAAASNRQRLRKVPTPYNILEYQSNRPRGQRASRCSRPRRTRARPKRSVWAAAQGIIQVRQRRGGGIVEESNKLSFDVFRLVCGCLHHRVQPFRPRYRGRTKQTATSHRRDACCRQRGRFRDFR